MRALEVVVFLTLSQYIVADDCKANRALENTINAIVECVRGEMNQGWPEYGIPSLNPLQIKDLDINFGHDIHGWLKIQNTTFSGLTDWLTTDVSGKIGIFPPSYTVNVTFTFPRPILDTKYKIDLTAGDYNFFGDGHLNFVANNFAAAVNFKANILGEISFEYFNILVSMDDMDYFEISGVREDEEYSSTLSANILLNGVQILDENAPRINEIIGRAIMDSINGEGGDEDDFIFNLLERCL